MAKVLIVDDEAANRLLVRTLLQYAGHEVLEAENAGLALESALEHHPDLIIVDLYLPGTNGTQFIQRVRSVADLRETKVALYTGTKVDAMLSDFMQVHGVAHVIPKPAEPEDFLRIVGDALKT